jgi:hypothetical protein
MSKFQQVLTRFAVPTVPIKSIEFVHEKYIGTAISFDRLTFRTKNIHMDDANTGKSKAFIGNLTKDPHIYAKLRNFTLILNIDPRWITTSTAFTLFRSGQSTFSGLARIANVDYENRRMSATPWVVGLPPGLTEVLFGGETIRVSRQRKPWTPTNLEALMDFEEGKRRGQYFLTAPDSCDLCGRLLANEKFMVDGEVAPNGMWGCVCGRCFEEHGKGIEYGTGQLYLNDSDGWLLVGGFRPAGMMEEE